MVLRAGTNRFTPAEVAAQWQSVAGRDARGGLFAHPEFIAQFRRAFGGRADFFDVLALRDDGRVGAVLPMMRCQLRRGPALVPRYDYLSGDDAFLTGPVRRAMIPVRQISPVMGLEASHLRLTAAQSPDMPKDRIWAALARQLASMRRWDMAILPLEQGDVSGCAAAARAAGLHAIRHPLGRDFHAIETMDSLDGILARSSGKFRQNIRRAERTAAADGAEFDVVSGDKVTPLLAEFASLSNESWKASNTNPEKGGALRVPYAGGQQQFYESLCGAQGLHPVLGFARMGGVMQAACLGFYQGGCLTTLLIFQRPTRGAASYGRLVMHRMFDWAHRQGASRIDLNSNAEWVQAYSDSAAVVDHLLLFPPGPYAGMLRRLALRRGAAA